MSIAPRDLIAALALLGGASLVAAQSIGDDRRALVQAQKQAEIAANRVARLEAAATAARDSAAQARARSVAVAARVQAAEADIQAAQARIAVIERLRIAQRARLAERQGPTIRLVAALQTLARRPAALALVQPGTVGDMVHARATLAAIMPAVMARTGDLRVEVERGRELRAEADRALAAVRDGQAELVTERNRLASLAAERRAAASRIETSAVAEQDRALALGEEARDLTDLVSKVDDAARRRARLASLPGPVMRPAQPGAARPLPAGAETPEASQAPYRMPVVGQVTTGLGEISDTGIRARGMTIATRANAQVVAPTGGRVAFAAPYRGFGSIVIIDHGRGWTTTITGLAALDVAAGDTVDQGSPIGRAGRVRPAITVELRRNGTPVDIARIVS